ncbi:MAG TPA: AMP-binding protein [Steroidobacteraceae bacterium]|nr:AMP-binding protein [Steroidobacteraceae bacterium]
MSRLWDFIAPPGTQGIDGVFHGREATVHLAQLERASIFGGAPESLRGRSVLLAVRDQLAAALALVELDGVARRMVLCTPDLTHEQLAGVAETAEAEAIVLDPASHPAAAFAASRAGSIASVEVSPLPAPANVDRARDGRTEWVLLTSGTTGTPKLVLHSLDSLGGALATQTQGGARMVWSTFYDIRRYGGLQIFLRAVLSRSPLVLSSAGESPREFFTRGAAARVTHISGTPSHWRRVLMSGDASVIDPDYVRASGEVADQALLDSLHAAYPRARIAHAFASTEAGVAFDVNDGRAGFPQELLSRGGDIELRVTDQTLRIRSRRNAVRYLGAAAAVLRSEDGFVDTGDMVELVDGRYYFRGRRGGVINVGGLKVYPEEVEAVLNADSRVRMSLVRAKKSPITGALVIADVVLSDPAPGAQAADAETVKAELLAACRRALAAHKVPAMLRFVPSLEVTAAGKLIRPAG